MPTRCGTCGALKDLAIGIAYDDFGSGQARLIELVEVPPDVLKFDIALTRDVHRASCKRETHAAKPGENGAATWESWPWRRARRPRKNRACLELGFDLHQGFYYGKPTSGRDLACE